MAIGFTLQKFLIFADVNQKEFFMLYHKEANALEIETDALIHQCNCFCTMGAGIAKQIKRKYPEAYEADNKTKEGDRSKLGTFSCALSNGKMVFNLYSQFEYGSNEKKTDYDAFAKGIKAIRDYMIEENIKSIAIPYGIGCGLAGGSWEIIETILQTEFGNSQIDAYICEIK